MSPPHSPSELRAASAPHREHGSGRLAHLYRVWLLRYIVPAGVISVFLHALNLI